MKTEKRNIRTLIIARLIIVTTLSVATYAATLTERIQTLRTMVTAADRAGVLA